MWHMAQGIHSEEELTVYFLWYVSVCNCWSSHCTSTVWSRYNRVEGVQAIGPCCNRIGDKESCPILSPNYFFHLHSAQKLGTLWNSKRRCPIIGKCVLVFLQCLKCCAFCNSRPGNNRGSACCGAKPRLRYIEIRVVEKWVISSSDCSLQETCASVQLRLNSRI